jgi:hypothetical protein
MKPSLLWMKVFLLSYIKGEVNKLMFKSLNETHDYLAHDLMEYVGQNTSKDIIQSLESMEFEEIVQFKQTMEEILLVISKEVIYN